MHLYRINFLFITNSRYTKNSDANLHVRRETISLNIMSDSDMDFMEKIIMVLNYSINYNEIIN